MAKVEWVGGQWKEIIRRKDQVEGVGAALTCIGFLLKTSQSNDVRGGWWRMDACLIRQRRRVGWSLLLHRLTRFLLKLDHTRKCQGQSKRRLRKLTEI